MHDTLALGESIDVDLSGFESEAELEDFFWWYSMEFADGTKGHNAEMNFLIREGLVVAKNGYQSQLAEYQRFSRHLNYIREQGPVDNLDQVLVHPAFIPPDQADRPVSSTVAEDSASRVVSNFEAPTAVDGEQLDLFAV